MQQAFSQKPQDIGVGIYNPQTGQIILASYDQVAPGGHWDLISANNLKPSEGYGFTISSDGTIRRDIQFEYIQFETRTKHAGRCCKRCSTSAARRRPSQVTFNENSIPPMQTQNYISTDEVQLAQLAAAKLARLARGTLSLGISACLTGLPDAREFLPERVEMIKGFITVLRSITADSSRPSYTTALHAVRERANHLSEFLEQFERSFTLLAGHENRTRAELGENVDQLTRAYMQFLDTLQALLQLLAVERSFEEEKRQAGLMTEQFFLALLGSMEMKGQTKMEPDKGTA